MSILLMLPVSASWPSHASSVCSWPCHAPSVSQLTFSCLQCQPHDLLLMPPVCTADWFSCLRCQPADLLMPPVSASWPSHASSVSQLIFSCLLCRPADLLLMPQRCASWLSSHASNEASLRKLKWATEPVTLELVRAAWGWQHFTATHDEVDWTRNWATKPISYFPVNCAANNNISGTLVTHQEVCPTAVS